VNRRTHAYLLLALAAALFGTTFVVVKDALDVLSPLAFVGWRFAIGAMVLLVIGRPAGRAVWRDGSIAGIVLFAGYATQTIGLGLTSATNSGLITGLYVVFTPLIAALARRTSPAAATIAGAALSVAGLGALTITNTLTFEAGDVWTLACAVAFAVHIVLLAHLAPRHEVLGFTAVQLSVVAVAGLVLSGIIEDAPLPPESVWPTLLATGLIVTGGAFLIQVWAQTVVGPSRTAIVLALEPLFAVVTAALILRERLGVRGWIGAALIMVGTYVVLVFAPPEDADIRTAEAISEAH
jgi:drug/metabolite transporter (DMT)-like permease